MEHPQSPAQMLALGGLRRTETREAALGLLLRRRAPLSHATIRRALGEGPDRVTLYRTLEALRRAGLVHRVWGEDGVWRYGVHDPLAAGCPAGHPHFLCLRCGRMICLEGQRLPRVRVPDAFEVRSKQLVVLGTCAACRQRRALCKKEI